jgi:hypothetical protein
MSLRIHSRSINIICPSVCYLIPSKFYELNMHRWALSGNTVFSEYKKGGTFRLFTFPSLLRLLPDAARIF